MTKQEIFETVVERMRVDSSTCNDIGVGEVEKYRAQLREDMSDKEFLLLMKRYLASLRAPHIGFYSDTLQLGMAATVRRYENVLYVTYSEGSLTVGDEIICIDGRTIPEAEKEFFEFVGGVVAERQEWRSVLAFSEKITVKKQDGTCVEMDIPRIGAPMETEKYTAKEINQDTYYLKFVDFWQENVIHAFLAEQDDRICGHKNLIIDVRLNNGGSDLSYVPMVKYCYPEGKNWDSEEFVSREDYGGEINYTEHNADTRLEMLEQAYPGLPEEVKELAGKMIQELKDNRGKGFCQEETGFTISETGASMPERVVILTDYTCGSSGDSFVLNMKRSPKVTVLGRNTMGILDYSNVCMEKYDQFELWYPTSRLCALDHGIKMYGTGVPVDIYVPWTPEHLVRDVDMEKALEFLEKEIIDR